MNLYWNQYHILEMKLLNLKYAIEFSLDNKNTYSSELAAIIIQSCSELEIISKKFLKISDDTYMSIVFKKIADIYPELAHVTVGIANTGLLVSPYKYTLKYPKYWIAYNKIKHCRDIILNLSFRQSEESLKAAFTPEELKRICYTQATLENAITALAALLVMNTLTSNQTEIDIPFSQLFAITIHDKFCTPKMIKTGYDSLLSTISIKNDQKV